MINQFSRTELIFGEEALSKLSNCKVAVFGIGGVGGHLAETLVRGGIGAIDLIDNDSVSLTNINRQLVATHSTIGKQKTQVAKERLLDINPKLIVNTYDMFLLPENADQIDFSVYDYIVDAIDTVTAKLLLIEKANEHNIPIISCMGTGNKIEPTMLEISDIYKTSVCPLAKVMRHECKKRGIKKLKVLYSKEEAIDTSKNMIGYEEESSKRSIPGSTSFVPSAAGIIIASEVLKDLMNK